jgi:hypothetical protein
MKRITSRLLAAFAIPGVAVCLSFAMLNNCVPVSAQTSVEGSIQGYSCQFSTTQVVDAVPSTLGIGSTGKAVAATTNVRFQNGDFVIPDSGVVVSGFTPIEFDFLSIRFKLSRDDGDTLQNTFLQLCVQSPSDPSKTVVLQRPITQLDLDFNTFPGLIFLRVRPTDLRLPSGYVPKLQKITMGVRDPATGTLTVGPVEIDKDAQKITPQNIIVTNLGCNASVPCGPPLGGIGGGNGRASLLRAKLKARAAAREAAARARRERGH